MRKTAKGRWVPDPKPKPEKPTPLAWEYGLPVPESPFDMDWNLPPMPWWYPLMHFWAQVGRETLSREQADQSGVSSK